MEPTHARSGRRFVFTAISFLLPVRLPLPPRFVALTSSSLSTININWTRCSTIINCRLHSRSAQNTLSSPPPGDSFIAAAATLAAPRTRSHCGSNVHPLLAGAIESAALEQERQEEQDLQVQQGGTFYAVPSSGSQLDANEGKTRDATADPSPSDEDSRRAAAAPTNLTGRERWQRARQAGVARIFGRVFRARSLRRGLARVVSRPPSATASVETFHEHVDRPEVSFQARYVLLCNLDKQQKLPTKTAAASRQYDRQNTEVYSS